MVLINRIKKKSESDTSYTTIVYLPNPISKTATGSKVSQLTPAEESVEIPLTLTPDPVGHFKTQNGPKTVGGVRV